ncbi:hypothetical protein SAMN06297387_103412 [Streptomyces zhaozhouensis]|uniref:Uncharacterized protein n=1 Tax=Streptomyces zhaozhouensis TaxID=1300267 RepID=A0A286DTC2_9ACTN|nr:hypothetical protein SAMN06297387_103412 [Streptomyces zhaozhouensis]
MDVHPYEPRRPSASLRPASGAIPGMRSPYERAGGSQTPIYDSLCAEYRRLFRTLPGDRSGEEELRFVGFNTIRGVGVGSWRHLEYRPGGQARAELPPGRPEAAGER